MLQEVSSSLQPVRRGDGRTQHMQRTYPHSAWHERVCLVCWEHELQSYSLAMLANYHALSSVKASHCGYLHIWARFGYIGSAHIEVNRSIFIYVSKSQKDYEKKILYVEMAISVGI